MSNNVEMDDSILNETESVPPSFPPPDNLETPLEPKHLRDEERKPLPLSQRFLRGVKETLIIVTLALVFSAIIKTYFVQIYYVPSGSMETTLMPGDRIAVNRMARGGEDIHRGDVIVFVDPGGWLTPSEETRPKWQYYGEKALEFVGLLPTNTGEHLVKRVIGVGGDRVKCCTNEGKVTVNGVPLEEEYLPEGMAPSLETFDVTVPENTLWVMGDNRSNSRDSRFHLDDATHGFLPIENVVGRTFSVVFPFDRSQFLTDYSDVFKDVP